MISLVVKAMIALSLSAVIFGLLILMVKGIHADNYYEAGMYVAMSGLLGLIVILIFSVMLR